MYASPSVLVSDGYTRSEQKAHVSLISTRRKSAKAIACVNPRIFVGLPLLMPPFLMPQTKRCLYEVPKMGGMEREREREGEKEDRKGQVKKCRGPAWSHLEFHSSQNLEQSGMRRAVMFTLTSAWRLFSPNMSCRKAQSAWLSTCGSSCEGRVASSSNRPGGVETQFGGSPALFQTPLLSCSYPVSP